MNINRADKIVSIEDTPEGWREFAEFLAGKPKLPPKVFNEIWKVYWESETWKDRALKVKERDNFLCQECGTSKDLQVHHLTYERRWCERLEDLLTLCEPCHGGRSNGNGNGLIHIRLG